MSWLFFLFNFAMYSCVVAILCSLLSFVAALPSPDLAQVASVTVPRALASPTSFTTTNTIQTTNGNITETCIFTFTPVGQQIQEVQNCTTSMGSSQPFASLVTPSSTTSPMTVAAFVMPGTSIQVLPIGLGVYGGVTAIAVFFVAFVTWERVKYRKAFRARRMADASSTGYGGMAKS